MAISRCLSHSDLFFCLKSESMKTGHTDSNNILIFDEYLSMKAI